MPERRVGLLGFRTPSPSLLSPYGTQEPNMFTSKNAGTRDRSSQ